MFTTAGIIASTESALMLHAFELMLIVVVPVFALAIYFAWHYRASNTKARYEPEWEHSAIDELVWWAVPLEIVLVLAALAWGSTHALDGHRLLPSGEPPLQVEVVALPWKWLFVYPDLGIASVGALELPAGQPVTFSITADAPMNSFWIPALGGQVYAMTGMVTTLNLEASTTGVFEGVSSNYSGDGFARMRFNVTALRPDEFDAWVAQVRSAPQRLDQAAYAALSQPGTTTPLYYGAVEPHLFEQIVSQFMNPDNPSMH